MLPDPAAPDDADTRTSSLDIWLVRVLRTLLLERRCCINRARSVDVYAQRSRGQPPIKSDSRVTGRPQI
ncbi:MAG: hypothetical protein GAK41_01700 [Burkholderia gladioli]|nr:MAG: hypothetical protein GAK41_01700 [Burkholderia gladioli]